jgi:hypothetical protein
MPDIKEIQIFISCPGDLEKEKKILKTVCQQINDTLSSKDCKVRFEVKEWRSIIGQYGTRLQEIINLKINSYDIYLGMWWMRFGSRTGAIDPLTGEEFESGTHEEFVLAKQKWEAKKDLAIYLFFKEPKQTKDLKVIEQLTKVLKFKQSEQTNNWISEFKTSNNFKDKITHFLYGEVFNICQGKKRESIQFTLTAETKEKIVLFSNSIGEKIHTYIQRKLVHASVAKLKAKEFLAPNKVELSDLIYQSKRLIVLGDAGSGKSTELRQLFFHLSNNDGPIIPIFQCLNKYTPETGLENFLPDFWKEVRADNLLIIWDGLDEIQPEHFNSVLRQLSVFSTKYPNIRIVISSRTNFYDLPDKNSEGSLSGYEPYFIVDFGLAQIKTYLEEKSEISNAEAFIRNVWDHKLDDLVVKPFFLSVLTNAYSENKSLDLNRANLFKSYLIHKIKLDDNHFKGTYSIHSKKEEIVMLLQKVALSMEIMCKNIISDDELLQIVSPTEYDILKYCGVFKKSDDPGNSWQFEHNNIQEYLAAKSLSEQSFDKVVNFISVGPGIPKLIPSWINTLTFLFSLLKRDNNLFKELMTWLLTNDREAIVRFEREKIDIRQRIEIFKSIFEYYKKHDVWLRSNKFSDKDLARFGESDASIKFLLAELENKNSRTVKLNVVHILGYFNYEESSQKTKVKKALIREIEENKSDSQYLHTVIYSLNYSKLITKTDVKKLVKKLREIKSRYVRAALYSLVRRTDIQDDLIDYVIEGLSYVNSDVKIKGREDITLFDEAWNVEECIKAIKNPTALSKVIAYMSDNSGLLYMRSEHEIIQKIVENSSSDPTVANKIYYDVLGWLVKLVTQFRHESIKEVMVFFEKTGKRDVAFMDIWNREMDADKKIMALSVIASQNTIQFIVDKYNNHELTRNDLQRFYFDLQWNRNEILPEFTNLLKTRTDFEIQDPLPKVDYDTIREKRNQESFDLLFFPSEIEKEILSVFEKEQTEVLDFDKLFDIRKGNNKYVDMEERYSSIAIEILRDFANNGQSVKLATVKSWFKKIESVKWYLLSKIYRYILETKVKISEEQKKWIVNWSNKQLETVDFGNSISEKDGGSITFNHVAIYLWDFFRRFDLTFSKDIMLDMLSFDYFEKHNWVGIDYLVKKLNKRDVENRIKENLKKGIKAIPILNNHVKFAVEHTLVDVYPIIRQEILNGKHSGYDRRTLLKIYFDNTKDIKGLKMIFLKCDFEIRWDIVEMLLKSEETSFLKKHLTKIYAESLNEEESLKALECLIRLQDLSSVQSYTALAKRKGKDFLKKINQNCLSSLTSNEFLPYLMDLLKVSYDQNYEVEHFNIFNSIVIGAIQMIGLKDQKSLDNVVTQLNNFIQKNKKNTPNVKYLIHTIHKMEEQFYVNKVNVFSIDQVKAKVNSIFK